MPDLRSMCLTVSVFLSATAVAGVAAAGPIENLPGRWTGWGQMTISGGATEKMKCIATYRPQRGKGALKHNLRCASPSYKIDAAASMTVVNGRVTGNWEERNYSTRGAMKGRVTSDGISVNIDGGSFRASMRVETSKCRQSMNIRPSGMEITRIAVQMSKC